MQMDFIIRNDPDVSGCGRVTFGRGVRGVHTQRHPELKERVHLNKYDMIYDIIIKKFGVNAIF